MFAINNPLVSSTDDRYLYLSEIPTGAEEADETPILTEPDQPSQDETKVERMARNAARRSIR
jgi:hypothetical protein